MKKSLPVWRCVECLNEWHVDLFTQISPIQKASVVIDQVMDRKAETFTQLPGAICQILLHKYILTSKCHEITLNNNLFYIPTT